MDIIGLVQSMPAEQRQGAIQALDACTRPLTAREVEGALRGSGLSKSRAAMFAASLVRAGIAVVAVTGGNHG